jgi:L-threonylcarbamoyladenylate synthase
MNILKSTPESIQSAAQLLREGHLIGVPTETVYGLAADATNDLAVAKIYETKGRPQFNPLIVHVAFLEQARQYVDFTPLAEKLAKAFWPGPLTLVLPRLKDANISHLVSAGLDTIAIRCPAHEVMSDLISACGRPLAAPSANPSGRISPTTAQHVYDGFSGMPEPKLILDGGACQVGLESTVVDATGSEAVILRPGGLSEETIATICSVSQAKAHDTISSPGMLAKHYSPKHKLRLNATQAEPGEALLAFGPHHMQAEYVLNLSPTMDLTKAAANLFSMLHQLDALDCSGIAVMEIPHTGLGIAINDRLNRAAED